MNQKLRAQVIAEWRGLPVMPTKPNRSRNIGKILESIFFNLNLSERLEETAVLQAWHDIVGDFFAHHSKPLRLKAGILYVQVFQPSVRYELDRTWKSQFLKKLQEKFGKKTIREIRF